MLSNRKKWRLYMGVVCHEDRRHHIEDFDGAVLVILGSWDERHRRFHCCLAAALVRRPPPPRVRVAGRCEPSSPVAPLVGGVVLHYRRRNNNGGRRRGGRHKRATLAPAGLYTCRGVEGEAAGAGCTNHVADGGSTVARAWWRAGLDGTDLGERRGEGARCGGGLVESAGAASVVHVKGRV